MVETQPVDVRAIVAEIEAEVRRKRAAGAYPTALLSRLRAEFRLAEEVEPPEALALIGSPQPLRSDRPAVGRAIVFGKRVTRRLLAWYVAPIAQDQTRFNVAILRELRRIEQRLQRAETVWTRPQGSPPQDAATARFGDLIEKRVTATVGLLQDAPPGVVLVGGASAGFLKRLRAAREAVEAIEGDVIGALRRAPTASASAIVLPGLLPRLSPAELLEIVPHCVAALSAGGVLVCDAANSGHPDVPSEPSDIDALLRRHVSMTTFELLAEAAGLSQVRRIDLDGGRWYAAAATRPPTT